MPVLPSRLSSSAGLSKKLASAACATGGRDEVVVVVVVVVDDDAGPLCLLLSQPATNSPMAATATAAVRWRMSQIAFLVWCGRSIRQTERRPPPTGAKRAPSESAFTAGSRPRRSQSPT